MQASDRIRAASACAVALAVVLASGGVHAEGDPVLINPKEVKWGAAPPSLPPGAKVAVLFGNPAETGPYVIRVSIPGGYRIPLHQHAHDQRITVMSGSLFLGDSWDPKYAREVKAGGFVVQPAKIAKFVFTKKSPAIVEMHGEGPFEMNYANPQDDPQKYVGGKKYYFPSQYEESERKATSGPQAPTF